MSLGRLAEIEARYGIGRTRMDVGTKTEMLRVVHELIAEVRRQFREGRPAAPASVPKGGYSTGGRIEGDGRTPVISNEHGCWVLVPLATYQLQVAARGILPVGGLDDPAAPWHAPCDLMPEEGDALDAALREARGIEGGGS